MKTFENYYVYYYVIMAYRILVSQKNTTQEDDLIQILHELMDRYDNKSIEDLVNK